MVESGRSSLIGLRERKKSQTKLAIQKVALRLFAERGYENSTIDEIAEAAEISRGTFFHYFPTKADILLTDVFDNDLLNIYRSIPQNAGPVQALRLSLEKVYAGISEQDQEYERQREQFLRQVPELGGAITQIVLRSLPVLTQIVAERANLPEDDLSVKILAGSIIGLSIVTWSSIPLENDHFMQLFIDQLDKGLEILEQRFDRPAMMHT